MAKYLIDGENKGLVEGMDKATYLPGGAVPVEYGGTGATNAAQARVNLGISLAGLNIIWTHPDILNGNTTLDRLYATYDNPIYVDANYDDYNLFVLVYSKGNSYETTKNFYSNVFTCKPRNASVGVGLTTQFDMTCVQVGGNTCFYNRHFWFSTSFHKDYFYLDSYTELSYITNSTDVAIYTYKAADPTDPLYLDLIPVYILGGNC